MLRLFRQYKCFFPIRFPFCGILHHMGNACVFSSNFPQYYKSQRNPSNGEGLGNWFQCFFHKMGGFSIRFQSCGVLHHMRNARIFSSVSHSTVNNRKTHRMGKAWEIDSWENPRKPIVCGEPGKLILILFPQHGCFFPLDSHPMLYFIIFKIHGIPHQLSRAWENAVKSIELGQPGKLVPIFSPTYGYFSSIRFPFYGILYHMGNA